MKGISRVVFSLGVVVLLIGLLSGIANRQILNSGRFASHADSVRADPAVARQLGQVITNRVIQTNPNLIGLRPLLESASTTVVSSPALGPIVRATVAPLQRAIATGDNDQVVLRLADVGALLVAAITTLSPDARATIPPDLDVQLAAVGGHEFTGQIIGWTHLVGVLSWLLPILAFLLLTGSALVRSREPRSLIRALGRGLVATAAVMAVLLIIVGFAISLVDRDTLSGALTGAVWNEFDGTLWLTTSIAAMAGLLIVAVSSPGFELEAMAILRRSRSMVLQLPETPKARAVRALGLLGVGALTLARPQTVLIAVATVIGFLFLVNGLRELIAVLIQSWRRGMVPSNWEGFARAKEWGVRGIAVASCVALVGLLVWAALPADSSRAGATAVSSTSGPCNGHRQLCDRRYDQVAFPATHNSMSAADQPGWFLAEQPDGVISQLNNGIRVFLIDSWPGQQTQRDGIVATAGESRKKALDEAEKTYGASVVSSALRLRDALNLRPTGPTKPYLCHALCELGATEWEPLMSEVRTWLDEHPREVVTFFVQDEVSPADTATVVKESGLMPYVHTQRVGQPWPTLGQMISSGKRVVFLMEHTSGGAKYPWLLDGNTWVQDTPFTFTSASQFTCKHLRGVDDAPLFLVNHWLSNYASRVSDAEKVNAEGVLLPRLRTCQRERGLLPNYVAVDNYDRGDLIASVDKINGLS